MYKFIVAFAVLGLALATPLEQAPQQSYAAQPQASSNVETRIPYPINGHTLKQQYDEGKVPEIEGYGVQTGYEGYLVPEYPLATSTGMSSMAGAAATAVFPWLASWPVTVAYTAVIWVLSHIPSIFIGSLVTLGICKLTPICHKFDYFAFKAVEEFEEEFRSLATPERLARASQLVHMAIEKYRDMQTGSQKTTIPEAADEEEE